VNIRNHEESSALILSPVEEGRDGGAAEHESTGHRTIQILAERTLDRPRLDYSHRFASATLKARSVVLSTLLDCFDKGDAVPVLILDHDNPYVCTDHWPARVNTTLLEVGDLLIKTGNGQRH